jgi:hypothetical protein
MKRIYLLGIAIALAVPALLAAQVPSPANEHASETARSKSIPAAQASDTAKSKVAQAMARRATHVRGEAVGLDNRPVTPATAATRATPATPAQPGAGAGGRAIPATPATPAGPALEHRPPQAGTGHGRKP